MKDFARRLQVIRQQHGLTQADLAKKAKLSHGYIARLEIGMHNPSMATLVKLAKGLKIVPAELLV